MAINLGRRLAGIRGMGPPISSGGRSRVLSSLSSPMVDCMALGVAGAGDGWFARRRGSGEVSSSDRFVPIRCSVLALTVQQARRVVISAPLYTFSGHAKMAHVTQGQQDRMRPMAGRLAVGELAQVAL